MNANALARTLRTGGYEALARNLPARLARGDRDIEWRGVMFSFGTAFKMEEWSVAAVTSGRNTLIADESTVHVSADKLFPKRKRGRPKADSKRFELRLPATTADRLERCAKATGKDKSTLARAALRVYLSARGF